MGKSKTETMHTIVMPDSWIWNGVRHEKGIQPVSDEVFREFRKSKVKFQTFSRLIHKRSRQPKLKAVTV